MTTSERCRAMHIGSQITPCGIIIVGFGAAGKRFHRVVKHMADIRDSGIRLLGIVEPRAKGPLPAECPIFTDLETALATTLADVAIVAVNEESHAEVLGRLARSNVRTILCEKPVTATLEEARTLPKSLHEKRFAMNMVERFSPIVDDYRAWVGTKPGLRPTRVQFFWGKHRVRDNRPTMGVMSEIIHPLDLTAHLFGCSRWRLLDGFAHLSDFAHTGAGLDDSVHCKLLANDDCVVSAHASFAWPDRRREITAFLQDDEGSCYQANLVFDTPLWDCDTLTIRHICSRTGERRTVQSRSYTNADFPASLHQVHKIHRFLLNGLDARFDGDPHSARVALPEAIRLQEMLNTIKEALNSRGDSWNEKLFEARETARRTIAAGVP